MKAHRAHVMEKMHVHSVAELVHLAVSSRREMATVHPRHDDDSLTPEPAGATAPAGPCPRGNACTPQRTIFSRVPCRSHDRLHFVDETNPREAQPGQQRARKHELHWWRTTPGSGRLSGASSKAPATGCGPAIRRKSCWNGLASSGARRMSAVPGVRRALAGHVRFRAPSPPVRAGPLPPVIFVSAHDARSSVAGRARRRRLSAQAIPGEGSARHGGAGEACRKTAGGEGSRSEVPRGSRVDLPGMASSLPAPGRRQSKAGTARHG